MRIIFEEHQYAAEKVEDVLWEGAFKSVDGKVSINYVGYYYHPKLKDCVFILPRVLLEDVNGEERVFVEHAPDTSGQELIGGFSPEDLIDPENCRGLGERQRRFIYEFSVWIYRALDVYRHSRADQSIVYHEYVPIQGRGVLTREHTFLDVILALVRFQEENRDFLIFTVRNRHCGHNRINWTRTVAHSSSIFEGSCPVYLSPIRRRREVDFDEELFVIYYSILAYIRREYGFPIDLGMGYETISEPRFQHYLRGVGSIRLRAIKYKYFSDRAVRLWLLCYAFFERSERIVVNVRQKEYLLAKNFDRVFEAIVDELIGDSENEIPRELQALKKQKDGKLVDHIFRYRELIDDSSMGRKIFYIGDSKYYKRGHDLSAESFYKQFTYARNIVQFNLDLFLSPTESNGKIREAFPKLRDEVTEGYNIIPNFFISARIADDLGYRDDIEESSSKRREFVSRQFDNRLFDRDTLLLSRYDVNFLWVVSLYARNNPKQKKAWKEKVRGIFRRNVQRLLSRHFRFSAMTPKPGVAAETFLAEHFQSLLGKVFTPYVSDENRTYYSLALQKPEVPFDPAHPLSEDVIRKINRENDRVLNLIAGSFFVADCPIGENPADRLRAQVASGEGVANRPKVVVEGIPLTRHYVKRYLDDFFLVGYCRDDAHFDWMHSHPTKYKRTSMYNVRIGETEGGVNPLLRMVKEPRFLILYNGVECSIPWQVHVYRIRSVKAYANEEMRNRLAYPAKENRDYLCYELDEEVNLGVVDIKRMVSFLRSEGGIACREGGPMYCKGAEIAAFIHD